MEQHPVLDCDTVCVFALVFQWKGYRVLTTSAPKLKKKIAMEHLRNILRHPQRKFTIYESAYVGVMTIILSCRIALRILPRIARYVKRLI